MNIKDRIRDLRTHAHLTQAQLGNEIGVSPDTIRSYEAGRREPNSKVMASLEKFFNVSGAYLRGETDQMKWDDMTEVINDNLPIAANSLINSARRGTDKTSALLFDFFVEYRSLINAEQKRGMDTHSDFASKIFMETAYCIQKLLANEDKLEKWDQICGDSLLKISRLFLEFQTELLEQKKNSKNN